MKWGIKMVVLLVEWS